MSDTERIVRIGGACGFWGDSSLGAVQLFNDGLVDYLVFDYLAELTMSLLARARAKDPALGYATDFVSVLKLVLPRLKQAGIRVVANAGGINPTACAKAIGAMCKDAGIDLRVAVVEGDDVSSLVPELRKEGVTDMFSGGAFPETILGANAYLGATPIAKALAEGADIVVTGRVADSALALGILMHEFGWTSDDWDLLAAGSLCGHIIECGAQATGGLHTDWEKVPDWANIGYPIAECRADGGFVVTKPEATGGLVTTMVLAEQMLYEIGDPSSYLLPDVVADFTEVIMRQIGENRVEVTGAKGRPPSDSYKVSAIFADGFRAFATLSIIGIDADRKARRTAEAILERTRVMLKARKMADYRAVDIEILGAESIYGPHATVRAPREVVMKLGVEHEDAAALAVFAREIAPAGTSFAPGTTGFAGGRPRPVPVVRLFSLLIAKDRLPAPTVSLGDEKWQVPIVTRPAASRRAQRLEPVASEQSAGPTVFLKLVDLAFARSGDKGDSANIGVIARDPRLVPIIRRELTAERVAAYFAHLVKGEVVRYEVPGVHGFNFLMTQALGGGGMASLRNDPLGKGLAQMLLDIEVAVPADLARQAGPVGG